MKLTFGDKAFISLATFFAICLAWLRYFDAESLWIGASIAIPIVVAFIKLLSRL